MTLGDIGMVRSRRSSLIAWCGAFIGKEIVETLRGCEWIVLDLKLQFLRTLFEWRTASGSFSFSNLLDFSDHGNFGSSCDVVLVYELCTWWDSLMRLPSYRLWDPHMWEGGLMRPSHKILFCVLGAFFHQIKLIRDKKKIWKRINSHICCILTSMLFCHNICENFHLKTQ